MLLQNSENISLKLNFYLSRSYCHCSIDIPVNMHKNNFHGHLHIFDDIHVLDRCIHPGLKESRKAKHWSLKEKLRDYKINVVWGS